MTTYLLAYSFVGRAGPGNGRAALELDGPITFADVRRFEVQVIDANGFRSVCVISVSELPGGLG